MPDLAIVAESSLMSLLRWSYKAGMDKFMSSSNRQITLVSDNFYHLPFVLSPEIWLVIFRFGIGDFKIWCSELHNMYSSLFQGVFFLTGHQEFWLVP